MTWVHCLQPVRFHILWSVNILPVYIFKIIPHLHGRDPSKTWTVKEVWAVRTLKVHVSVRSI